MEYENPYILPNGVQPLNRKYLSPSFIRILMRQCSAQAFFKYAKDVQVKELPYIIAPISSWAHGKIADAINNNDRSVIESPDYGELYDLIGRQKVLLADEKIKTYPKISDEVWRDLCTKMFEYVLRNELIGRAEAEKRIKKPFTKPNGEHANDLLGYIDIIETDHEGYQMIYDAKMKAKCPTQSDEDDYRFQMCAYSWMTGIRSAIVFCTYYHNREKKVKQREYKFSFTDRDHLLLMNLMRKADFVQKTALFEAVRGFEYCGNCVFNGTYCQANFL